jgi:hypothetical protein
MYLHSIARIGFPEELKRKSFHLKFKAMKLSDINLLFETETFIELSSEETAILF